MVLPLGAAKDYGFILKRIMGISDKVYKIKKKDEHNIENIKQTKLKARKMFKYFL